MESDLPDSRNDRGEQGNACMVQLAQSVQQRAKEHLSTVSRERC